MALLLMTEKRLTKVLETRDERTLVQLRSNTSNLSYPAQWLVDIFASIGGNSTSGVAVNENTALSIAAVKSCVQEISRGIANMPLKKYSGGEVAKVVRFELMERPNPYMNGYDWVSIMVASDCYKGNAYSYIQRDRSGVTPQALHPIPTTSVTPYYSNGQLFYRISSFNIQNLNLDIPEDVPARDMLHFKTMSMSNPLVGENPIKLHADTFGINISALNSQAKAQKNGLLKFLVKSQSKLTPDQSKQTKDSLQDLIYKEDSIAVMPAGAELERIQLTPEDLKLLEVMKTTTSDICKIYGVSETIINGTADEAQYIHFYSSCLMSYARPIEQEMSYKLLTESEKRQGYYLKFNFDSVMRATADKRAEVYAKNITNGVMTQNEARKKEDLPPLENGNIQYSPAQWLPSSKMEAWIEAKIQNLTSKTAGQNNNPDGNNNDIQA